ncbi:hypothetical protein CPB83DRAFT_897196 [Crepidotus variabilis]|uniref:Uncharacterized protein n=1 Tax=Crepidotus variabilis TaxID=179855 RepID=A0A9P6JLH3_9AGAR|nr:hypothetical protein CPB83DRAFT_897196 [Crepidotus variabilis]
MKYTEEQLVNGASTLIQGFIPKHNLTPSLNFVVIQSNFNQALNLQPIDNMARMSTLASIITFFIFIFSTAAITSTASPVAQIRRMMDFGELGEAAPDEVNSGLN